jgi:uncharacterized protein
LADKFSRLTALRPARTALEHPAPLRSPDSHVDPLARLLGAGIARNHYGEHLSIRNWFASPEFVEPSATAVELLTRTKPSRNRPSRENFWPATTKRANRGIAVSRAAMAACMEPEKWLFLDTETTGLSGGTGTYAFLVGLAWWDSGGLQIEQLFLRDFSEEHSLLHELAARIAQRPVLVTFNGKTFDWPLLENRFTMTRAIQVPKLAAHLDLLHPARALWKLRLGSVRLIDLEREVLGAEQLGLHRFGDVASALIPQYYFDYLRGGSPDPLAGVVKHNQMDLRGLAALFGKINSLLDERGSLAEEASLDLFGLSRFLDRRGERERAQSACSLALHAGLPAELRRQAHRELALLAKRKGDWQQAAKIWQELAADPKDGIEACEQLAMHYERQCKDFERALEFAQLALMKLERQGWSVRDPIWHARRARRQKKLMCRVTRLRHRIKRNSTAPLLAKTAAGV